MGIFSAKFLGKLNDLRASGHATDQNQVAHLPDTKTRILQARFERGFGSGIEIITNLLQFCPGQGHVQMFGTGRVSRYERKVDLR